MFNPPSISRRQIFRIVYVVLTIAIVSSAGFIVWQQIQPHYTVTISINDNTRTLNTNATTVGEVLEDADVVIDRADRIDPPLSTRITDNMVIMVTKPRQLVLDDNGTIQRIYTHESNPYQILEEQDVTLNTNDAFLVNYRPASNNGNGDTIRHLQIIRAKSFQAYDGDDLIADGYSTAPTIGDLLAELDVTLYAADRITPSLEQPFNDGLTIEIQRSVPVIIEVDGKRIETRAAGDTVNDAVNSAGFQLSGQDFTIPPSNAQLTPNMTIEIMRVFESIEESYTPIPHRVLYYPNPALSDGEETVIQAGVDGIQVSHTRTRYENNQVVNRVTSGPWIVQPVVHQIVVYGTK